MSDGVTAIVVTHNSARHLAALGRALSSGSLVPVRMLVVDNASTDDTVAQARAAGFEVLERGTNRGFGSACNAGLRAASTELVLFCNPDVRPASAALERLAAVLLGTRTAAIAGAALDDPPVARRFSRITADLVSFIPRRLYHRMDRFSREVPVDHGEDHVVVDYVVGAFILCRTAAVRSIGGFDERFFLYCEEEDLCRRLGDRGWQTLFVSSAVANHDASTSSEGAGAAVTAPFLFHSRYWYYRKYHRRVYAEFARCILAACVAIDRAYRALSQRRQAYGPGTALAPFHSIASIRREYERRTGCIAAPNSLGVRQAARRD
jgi:N-acetylglucosaminyl-diphospho-decaprenol L-rhamnosyltransferase